MNICLSISDVHCIWRCWLVSDKTQITGTTPLCQAWQQCTEVFGKQIYTMHSTVVHTHLYTDIESTSGVGQKSKQQYLDVWIEDACCWLEHCSNYAFYSCFFTKLHLYRISFYRITVLQYNFEYKIADTIYCTLYYPLPT